MAAGSATGFRGRAAMMALGLAALVAGAETSGAGGASGAGPEVAEPAPETSGAEAAVSGAGEEEAERAGSDSGTRGAGEPDVATPEAPAEPDAAGFQDWLRQFQRRALAAGIPAETFARAMTGMQPDPQVIARDRSQNEFTRQIWDYLDSAVSEDRVARGRAALAQHRAVLEAIAARYGVEPEILAAIWGLETAYGSYRGDLPVLRSLATLAHEGRRRAFFEAELLAALRIVQAGHVAPEAFRGSWAGASGHVQFMPSSFWRFAVDWDHDGRRDLWGADPGDALASAAAYLATNGWQPGLPWGMEVTLPAGFPWEQSGERIRKPVAAWTALGVRDVNGREITVEAPASVLLPAGHEGAAFLIFANFQVLESYNPADAYVIAVGHLADRLRGGPPIANAWPRADPALSYAEKRELQQLLLAAGHDPQGIDGIMGPDTIEAVRRYQAAEGLVPDGYASARLLARLRGD